MANNCCNRRCVLLNLTYGVAINNIIGGIRSLCLGTSQNIFAGIILLALAVLLIVGIRKNNRKLVLTFFIIEVILLALGTVSFIISLVGASRVRHTPGPEITIFFVAFGISLVINWFLMGAVFMYYKEMADIKREGVRDADVERGENEDNKVSNNLAV